MKIMKVLEKVIQSNFQPDRQDVVWIDTSDPTNPMVKIYNNGEWKLASESGVPNDVVRGVGIKHIINIDKDDFDALVDKDQETIYIVKDDPTNGHEWVDIGQIDDEGYHILWATKNIGAETEYDDGKYFAFGDTVGYYAEDEHNFNLDNCPYFDGDDENPHFSKYNEEDGLTDLEPEDDAAHVQWGGKWRVPNMTETMSLLINFLDSNQITRYNNIPYCVVSDGAGEKALITTSGHFSGTERSRYHDEDPEGYIYAYVLASYIYNTSHGSSLKQYAYVSYDENGYVDEIAGDGSPRFVGSTIRPIIKFKDISELNTTYKLYFGDSELSGDTIQSDWNQEDSTKVNYIKNKPNVSKKIVVSGLSDLTNEQWEQLNVGDVIVEDQTPDAYLYQVIYADKSGPDYKNIQVNMSSFNAMCDDAEYCEYKASKDGNNWTIQQYYRDLSNPLNNPKFCLDWANLVRGKTQDSIGWYTIPGDKYPFRIPFAKVEGNFLIYDTQQGEGDPHNYNVRDFINDAGLPDDFVGSTINALIVFGYINDRNIGGITGGCTILCFIQDDEGTCFAHYYDI